MSDIKSAYQAVALAVWQSLVQKYPEEPVEQDANDLEEFEQVRHADSNGQNFAQPESLPVRDSSKTNPDN